MQLQNNLASKPTITRWMN